MKKSRLNWKGTLHRRRPWIKRKANLENLSRPIVLFKKGVKFVKKCKLVMP